MSMTRILTLPPKSENRVEGDPGSGYSGTSSGIHGSGADDTPCLAGRGHPSSVPTAASAILVARYHASFRVVHTTRNRYSPCTPETIQRAPCFSSFGQETAWTTDQPPSRRRAMGSTASGYALM